jgi:hypothetical protein
MAKNHDQKFVLVVASIVGAAVLLIGVLGVWNSF